jgi:hypothetical protein
LLSIWPATSGINASREDAISKQVDYTAALEIGALQPSFEKAAAG